MALRRMLSKRYINENRASTTLSWRGVMQNSPISSENNAALYREFITSPDSSTADSAGFFSRFLLQRREINQAAGGRDFPMFLTLPVGKKLREKLKSFNGGGESPVEAEFGGLISSMGNVRKVIRCAQVEKVKVRLREIPMNWIPYKEYVKICGDGCGNKDQGLEFAKMLDDSGNVVVLGDVVLLRPEQVAESVEKMMREAMMLPNDPRRKHLEELEQQKAKIDEMAQSQVRKELYFGLSYLIIQTMGFIRLTFWDLGWDIMEPVCFFTASFHFALAYGFYLRTAKEPSFDGYFQRRFIYKQKKLMKIHNFDREKYNDLCKALNPSSAACSYNSNSGFYNVA